MSNPNPKPPIKPSGRIKWLAFAIAFVIALYTGGWFYAAGQVADIADEQIDDLQTRGISVSCPDRDVRGYPFRIGVFCSDFDVAAPGEELRFDGGAFRSAAQVYAPRRAVIEIDAPLTVRLGDNEISLDYTVGQAALEARTTGLRNLSVEFTEGSIETGTISAQWDRLTIFSRAANDDLEIAWQAVGLVPGGAETPPLLTDADVLVEDFSYETRSLRGKRGQLRRMTIGLSDDRGLLATGPFSVSDEGLVDADVEVRVVDVPGLIAQLEETSPRIAAAIDGVLQLAPASDDESDEASLTVTIRQGRARLGIVPLGTIPPL